MKWSAQQSTVLVAAADTAPVKIQNTFHLDVYEALQVEEEAQDNKLSRCGAE